MVEIDNAVDEDFLGDSTVKKLLLHKNVRFIGVAVGLLGGIGGKIDVIIVELFILLEGERVKERKESLTILVVFCCKVEET